MRIQRLVNNAERLERQVLEQLQIRKEKYDERTERWQRSRRGKEFKLDTHLLKNLAQALEDFTRGMIKEEEE